MNIHKVRDEALNFFRKHDEHNYQMYIHEQIHFTPCELSDRNILNHWMTYNHIATKWIPIARMIERGIL